MSDKVGIVSLGCAKNRVDAEMLLFNLKNAGFDLVEDVSMADAAIVNTCGFIESAKQESIDEILELAQLKKEGKIKAIIVTGCLAQRYKNDIMEQLYEVDAVMGIGANADIAQVVTDALNDKKTEIFPSKTDMPLDGGRIQSTPHHYAYLKVADGCDNCCTYCAIPLIRGNFRSRKMENIIEEAKTFAKKGVKELLVIAQDTTRYGEDIYGRLMLPELLNKLCEIDGIKWIRILYCYPDRITDELIQTIKSQNKILNYIDIPLQHCNGRVLKAMNRTGDKQSLLNLLNKVKKEIPDIILRTTLITGFPTETQQEFEELAEFIKEVKFQRLGCFAYSQEEDTPASVMEGQIDDEIKNKRAEIIMRQQQDIMSDFTASLVGRTIDVLVEGYDRYAQCYFGRSYMDAPEVDSIVFFSIKDKKPVTGSIVKVKIVDLLDCDPIGEML